MKQNYITDFWLNVEFFKFLDNHKNKLSAGTCHWNTPTQHSCFGDSLKTCLASFLDAR